MNATLLRFKVLNFRSTQESDWVNIANNTCFVGINEAGKTNLLVALWKLNPANDENIYPIDDYPRHLFSKFKPENRDKDVFIKADFELGKELQERLAKKLKCDAEQVRVALVERKFNGTYNVSLPYTKIDVYPREQIGNLFNNIEQKLIGLSL